VHALHQAECLQDPHSPHGTGQEPEYGNRNIQELTSENSPLLFFPVLQEGRVLLCPRSAEGVQNRGCGPDQGAPRATHPPHHAQRGTGRLSVKFPICLIVKCINLS